MRSEVERFGARIAVQAQITMGDAWERLDEQARAEVQRAVADFGELMIAGAAGAQVQVELLEAKATIKNWQFVGAAEARSVVLEVLSMTATMAGRFLAEAAATIAKGI